ncbi:MAG TPA: PKD domain-containing protein [Thermoanaerobaculia bacterium]|nr:PKD domain-containing protein [Thermoanaerobaculia bacterium]
MLAESTPGPASSSDAACAGSASAAEGLFASFPPCIDATFTGSGISGLPPFTYAWEVSNGYRFFGNPGVLNTAALPAGFYSARLAATNAYGTGRSAPFFFTIEALRFVSSPTCTNQGNRTARCTAVTEGATEHRWDWGDGTLSPWLVGCPGRDQSHTYAAAGTYSVRLRLRNCRDPLQVSVPVSVTVTASSPLQIVEFAADCPGGFCLFDVGEAVPFRHQVQGSPTTCAYDWDGDGFTDQVAGAAVATHVYSLPGSFTPRLTVTAGTQTASAAVPLPVIVFPSGPVPLFADGFESGTTQRWSLTVGKVVEGGRP